MLRSCAQLFQFSKLGFRPSQLHLDLVRIVHHPLSQRALLGEQVLDVILHVQLRMRFCPEVREAYEAEEKREVMVAMVAKHTLELREQLLVLLWHDEGDGGCKEDGVLEMRPRIGPPLELTVDRSKLRQETGSPLGIREWSSEHRHRVFDRNAIDRRVARDVAVTEQKRAVPHHAIRHRAEAGDVREETFLEQRRQRRIEIRELHQAEHRLDDRRLGARHHEK